MQKRTKIPEHTQQIWTERFWFSEDAEDQVNAFYHQVTGHIGMHKNEFYELNIVATGFGVHRIDGCEIPVKPGFMCVIPPGVMHGYATEVGLNVFHVLIRSRFLDRYVHELHALPGFMLLFDLSPYISQKSTKALSFQLYEHNVENVMRDVDGLVEMQRSNYPGRHVHKAARLLCLLAELANCIYDTRREIVSTPDRNTQLLIESMEFIRSNVGEEISIDILAGKAGMSRAHYTRLFRELTGCTPHDFILRCRIANARRLLCYTEASMADIAQQCGFCDSSHFSRVFSKQEGLKPSDYRALHSKRASFSMCTLLAPPCNLEE